VTANPVRVLEEHASVVQQLVAELTKEYRWAHGVAHARSVGDDVKVVTSTSDPTMTVLLSKRAARRACEDANQALVDCEKGINAALSQIGAALKLSDPPPTFEPLRYKADATRADLAEARAAKLRRIGRGEDVPE
jgi:hypothetical protein